MNDTNELISYVIEKTGWSIEYVLDLPLFFLTPLIAEWRYQDLKDRYREASNSAMVLSNWATANSKHHTYQIEDFIGQPPEIEEGEIEMNDFNFEITLSDGKLYKSRPMNLKMRIEIQKRFKCLYKEFINRFIDGDSEYQLYLIYVALKDNYPELTEEKLGEMISSETFIKIFKNILEYLLGKNLSSIIQAAEKSTIEKVDSEKTTTEPLTVTQQ